MTNARINKNPDVENDFFHLRLENILAGSVVPVFVFDVHRFGRWRNGVRKTI